LTNDLRFVGDRCVCLQHQINVAAFGSTVHPRPKQRDLRPSPKTAVAVLLIVLIWAGVRRMEASILQFD
jgi:hypothetical protein